MKSSSRDHAPVIGAALEITPAGAIGWLEEAAQYFRKRPTNGEDRAHWANVSNAEAAMMIARLVGALSSAEQVEDRGPGMNQT